MEILIIAIVAFLAALLTFFSGFGLGTILTPVMLIFFPPEIAISLTGIVHFCNNIFKLSIIGNQFNKEVYACLYFDCIFECVNYVIGHTEHNLEPDTTNYM